MDPQPSPIASAWTFVRGAELCFEQLTPGQTRTVGDAVALSLPLRRPAGQGNIVVGFLLSHDEAVKVARNMFDQPDGDISPDDLRDAGLEACNVLAASVLSACGGPADVDIGLPRALTMTEYQAIAEHAQVRACYVGRPPCAADDVRVVLTVFDWPAASEPGVSS